MRFNLPVPVQMTWTGSWESCLRISSPLRPKLTAADLRELWHGRGAGETVTADMVWAAPWPSKDAEHAGDAPPAPFSVRLLCLFWSRELGGPGEFWVGTASVPILAPPSGLAPLGSQTCIKGLFCPCLTLSACVSPSPLPPWPAVPLYPLSAELQHPKPFPWRGPCSPSSPHWA